MTDPEVETALRACKAAYKKGLIEAAQDMCNGCCHERPVRGSDGVSVFHEGGLPCTAAPIIIRLERSGGWTAQWPWPPDA